ncbi:uncharacterized protein At5g19025-like [Elaeis guineensis]|uniref:Uncharacterized protein At5g19025-like n=1 Tax=Elaeis guineensis var. tenera TaxID=51953 RepID=A0A6I9R6G9_ELAGV|nr:uncharacterized protein At5g19025-like [Elaeis guineensis]
MVDCRSLIEFCRAYQQRRIMAADSNNQNHPLTKGSKPSNPLSHPFCEHSVFSVIDVVMLLLVLVALGVLTLPCFKFIFHGASELVPVTYDLIGDVIYHAPVAYAAAFVLMLVTALAVWEILFKSRKCGNPYCKGLRKAAEFDIQLESEKCVKCLPPAMEEVLRGRPLDLGEDHKELEAELKKMAPTNGRTVLILRAPCGCPEGRMEVWGPKKVRRIKK